MAFHQVSSTSLTPSRPAPPAPQRAGPGATYNPAFSIPSSSGSSYSGIGGSPNPNSENIMGIHVVRSGVVSYKEDGFASWLWRPKWLFLKEQTLSIHKNEVSLICLPTLPPYHDPPGHHSITFSPTLDQPRVSDHQPPGYHQHRTDRPQTLLPPSRDERQTVPLVSQERRGIIRMAR